MHYSIYFIKSCCMRQRQDFPACAQRTLLEIYVSCHSSRLGEKDTTWLWARALRPPRASPAVHCSGGLLLPPLWSVSELMDWWNQLYGLTSTLRQTAVLPAVWHSSIKVSFPNKGLLFFSASWWTFACTEHLINTSHLIIAAFTFLSPGRAVSCL